MLFYEFNLRPQPQRIYVFLKRGGEIFKESGTPRPPPLNPLQLRRKPNAPHCRISMSVILKSPRHQKFDWLISVSCCFTNLTQDHNQRWSMFFLRGKERFSKTQKPQDPTTLNPLQLRRKPKPARCRISMSVILKCRRHQKFGWLLSVSCCFTNLTQDHNQRWSIFFLRGKEKFSKTQKPQDPTTLNPLQLRRKPKAARCRISMSVILKCRRHQKFGWLISVSCCFTNLTQDHNQRWSMFFLRGKERFSKTQKPQDPTTLNPLQLRRKPKPARCRISMSVILKCRRHQKFGWLLSVSCCFTNLTQDHNQRWSIFFLRGKETFSKTQKPQDPTTLNPLQLRRKPKAARCRISMSVILKCRRHQKFGWLLSVSCCFTKLTQDHNQRWSMFFLRGEERFSKNQEPQHPPPLNPLQLRRKPKAARCLISVSVILKSPRRHQKFGWLISVSCCFTSLTQDHNQRWSMFFLRGEERFSKNQEPQHPPPLNPLQLRRKPKAARCLISVSVILKSPRHQKFGWLISVSCCSTSLT